MQQSIICNGKKNKSFDNRKKNSFSLQKTDNCKNNRVRTWVFNLPAWRKYWPRRDDNHPELNLSTLKFIMLRFTGFIDSETSAWFLKPITDRNLLLQPFTAIHVPDRKMNKYSRQPSNKPHEKHGMEAYLFPLPQKSTVRFFYGL